MMAAPRWVIDRTAPLYFAFLVFILRYYVALLAIGYDVASFAALPLEQLVLSARGDIGQSFQEDRLFGHHIDCPQALAIRRQAPDLRSVRTSRRQGRSRHHRRLPRAA